MADSLDHLSTGRTQIEWLSSLNTEFKPKTNYRRTSIICTIGTIALTALSRGIEGALLTCAFRPEDEFRRKNQHAA